MNHPKKLYNVYKYYLFPALLINLLAISPLHADDTTTTIGDLSARLDDLERQIGDGGGKSDDENPGSRVTKEDLERIKEDVRALRGRSDDLNSLQDELQLLRDDVKKLKHENTELRAQRVSKTDNSSSYSDEEPTEKKKSEPTKSKQSTAHKKTSSDLEEETDSILQLLEKSASADDHEAITETSSKKRKKADIDSVRDAATKQAEDSSPTLGAGNAEALYNEAFKSYDKGSYKKAESSFTNFIKIYPDDALVSNAMYWKAECCFQQKNYKSAKILFFNAYKKNPQGPKAPDCLLRLGDILAEDGRSSDACTAWQKMSKDYPHMASETKEKLIKSSQKYGCELKLDNASKSGTKRSRTIAQADETATPITKRQRTKAS
jgi:tol-pal system protein YbgF